MTDTTKVTKVKIPRKLKAEILDQYDYLEKTLTLHKYLTGSEISEADLSAITSISVLDHMVPIKAKKYPRIVKWMEEFDKHPLLCKHQESGLRNVAKWIKKLVHLI